MTTYDEVYKVFISKIEDRELMGMEDEYLDYVLEGYLNTACARFTRCYKDLSNRDSESKSFMVPLSPFEIEILATIMVLAWLEPKINKIQLIKQALTDREFRIHSQAQHLRELQNLRNFYISEYNRLIVQYTYEFGNDVVWENMGRMG